jgi:hypothetical protein
MVDKANLTIVLDDERVHLNIDSFKTVRDLVRAALVVFEIDENPDHCHLAGPDRLYLPPKRIVHTDLESGACLSLRLPL